MFKLKLRHLHDIAAVPDTPGAPLVEFDTLREELRSRARFQIRARITWLILLALLVLLLSHLGLQFSLVRDKLPFLLGLHLSPDDFIQGAPLTILITLISISCCCVIATLVAAGRMSASPVAFALATFYGSFFRGTPLMLQVLLIYLALPQVGVVMGPVTSGVMALSLNYGAYLAETIRGGVLSVPPVQREAALALCLPRHVIALRVIAPQALRIIIPPAGSLFVSMLKDSSLVSLMGVWELNFVAQSYGRSTYHYMEMLIAAAAIYWVMSIVCELLQARLERRFGKGYARAHI
ncbi:polar amino acid transport system permease protein [Paraburkholderia sp. GAS38]|jgi:polar amino acid transport system permease protein|uniref:amino acid ABC transporter permease n=1 Tax=Paraburkholderia sp. GAS38 TaxID=3035133 RepID=UPI003D1C2E33